MANHKLRDISIHLDGSIIKEALDQLSKEISFVSRINAPMDTGVLRGSITIPKPIAYMTDAEAEAYLKSTKPKPKKAKRTKQKFEIIEAKPRKITL
jgi:hypothetical protein